MQLRQIVEAGMGAQEYQPPQAAPQLLADFYLLLILDSRPGGGANGRSELLTHELSQVKHTLVPYLRQHLLEKAGYSITCELRHLFDQVGYPKLYALNQAIKQGQTQGTVCSPKEFAQDLLNTAGVPPQVVELLFQSAVGWRRPDPQQVTMPVAYACARAGVRLFQNSDEVRWSGDYGGEPWALACRAWLTLYQASGITNQAIYCDKLVSVEHNTGSLLDKNKEYQGGWVRQLLDLKFEANDPEPLMRHASPFMRRLASQVLRSSYGRSWDSGRWGSSQSGRYDPQFLLRMRAQLAELCQRDGLRVEPNQLGTRPQLEISDEHGHVATALFTWQSVKLVADLDEHEFPMSRGVIPHVYRGVQERVAQQQRLRARFAS